MEERSRANGSRDFTNSMKPLQNQLRQVKRLAEEVSRNLKIVALISVPHANLLALNVPVLRYELEAGRGFAIVADEVHQLADRSTKAQEMNKCQANQSETGAMAWQRWRKATSR